MWSEQLSPSSAHGAPRGAKHDWPARRVETARISLKRTIRFRLATRAAQNGARPRIYS